MQFHLNFGLLLPDYKGYQKDVKLLIEFLNCLNPFSDNSSLRSISTGVETSSNVNVYGKGNWITLGVKSTVKVDRENIQVDPQLVF